MYARRLEFETQRTRLSAQREYEQKQLDQQKKKLGKMEETLRRIEALVAEQKQVCIFQRHNDSWIYKPGLC